MKKVSTTCCWSTHNGLGHRNFGDLVPETLRSGNHARVGDWRLAMAIARTAELRPDLLEERGVTSKELASR